MELFFLAVLILLMVVALTSGFPVAFALPGSAILSIGLAALCGWVFAGNPDAYFASLGEESLVAAFEPSAPALDSVRYMQCMYYLSRLGSPTQMIRFWLAHDNLEDACRYIIMGNQPEQVFMT